MQLGYRIFGCPDLITVAIPWKNEMSKVCSQVPEVRMFLENLVQSNGPTSCAFRLTCSDLQWKAVTLYTEWMVRKEVISSVELILFLVRWPSHLSIYSNSFRVMWIQIIHFNLAENNTLVLVSSATCGISQSLGLVIDNVSQFSSQGFNAKQIMHGS